MKIIYNDRIVVPCIISISCRQCVFGNNDICKVGNFYKRRDLRLQVFRENACNGFKYEDSI